MISEVDGFGCVPPFLFLLGRQDLGDPEVPKHGRSLRSHKPSRLGRCDVRKKFSAAEFRHPLSGA